MCCRYLDQISWGQDWQRYYLAEPLNFTVPSKAAANLLGGEACLWGEFIDETNLRQLLWPRVLPVAERLWSGEEVRDLGHAKERIAVQRCLMVREGGGGSWGGGEWAGRGEEEG